jgi:hypothetical protein
MKNLQEAKERKCPKCGELIKFEAVICKHCQSDLTEMHADEKERLSNLILDEKDLRAIASDFGVLPRAVKTILSHHFGVETVGKARTILGGGEIPRTASGSKIGKKGWLWIVGILGILFIAGWIMQTCERQSLQKSMQIEKEAENAAMQARTDSIQKYQLWFKSLTDQQQDSIRIAEKEAEAEQYIKRINKELEDLEKYSHTNLDIRPTDEDLVLNLALLDSWQNLYHEFSDKKGITLTLDKSISSYQRTLKRVLQKQYPVLRSAAVKNWQRKMWEHDIEVSGRGIGTSTLRFIGGVFASNASKQEFQTQIIESVRLMRFKKVEYLWYKYDDTYTYYTIASLKDSDIK